MLGAVVFAATAFSSNAAFNARLQGQSRGSTVWLDGNLQGWRDLDAIPCRVYLTGGPANNKVITVEFDHAQGRNPAIQDLFGFTPSANVVITKPPVLSAPANSARWTYTFTIKLLDSNPGCVKYYARLADGAHLNGGSSVGMRGSPSLGSLQIHKIGPACIVDLALVKTGPAQAAPGQVITYTLQYTNKPTSTVAAKTVQITDVVPPQVTVVAETLGGGRVVGNTVVWDLGTLAATNGGTLTYSVRVNANVAFGEVFTNAASISSAHKEANASDNTSSVTTRVVFNRAPIANPDSYQGTENQPLIIATPGVLANDTDADGNPLTATLVSAPAHGVVGLNADGSFTYTPTANYHGEDSFTYKANDGTADSLSASVLILLQPSKHNNVPVAVNDQYSVAKNALLNVPAPGVLGNDTDADGDSLTAVVVSGPAHGTLVLNANGSFAYSPTAGFVGEDSFGYEANDGITDSSAASVFVTVRATPPPPPTNHVPVAVNDHYQTSNKLLIITAPGVLANDADADGDVLTAILVSGPTHGTLILSTNGGFTYTPAAGFVGDDSFTYKADDGITNSSAASVSITVLPTPPPPPTNHAPVAVNDQYQTSKNTALNISAPGVLANDTDLDADMLTAILVSGPTHGALVLNTNGGFTYTPTAGFQGDDSFTYEAKDGITISSVASVFITVLPTPPPPPTNHAPVAVNDQYVTSTNSTLNVSAPGVLGNDSDADGNALTAVLVSLPGHGTLTLNVNGSFQYVPAAGFAGTDSYTYKANDGTVDSLPATVSIVVQGGGNTNPPPANLPPVVSLTSPTNGAIYIEGMDVPLIADASDPDGTVSHVDFLSNDLNAGSDTQTPYSIVLTNVTAGEYVFRAVATDDLGASMVSAPVSILVLEHPPFVAGPFRLNRQTGLFEQLVTVTNPTPFTFEGIRLWIMDVRAGATVWNATGRVENVPYIEATVAVPPGGSINIFIEYYTPDIRVPPSPIFFPEVL